MTFRYGLHVSIAALTLVFLHSLVAPSLASGFYWNPYSYFEADYDVSFSDDEVEIGETFDLVVWAHAKCIEDLPFGVDEAKATVDFVARHKEMGRTEMLRAGYSASIGPFPEFPDWEGDEYTVDERVTLTFPKGSSYGGYEVIAQLVYAEVDGMDVTELVPESYHSFVVGEISCVGDTPVETDFWADSGIPGHPLEGIEGETEFDFTGESSGGVGSCIYEWDFNNDGIIDSTEENPSWTYDDSDTYTVALTVSDIVLGASSDTEIKVNYITVYAPLEVAFLADSPVTGHPTEGYAGVTEFDFTNESIGGMPPYSYEWDFDNDGAIDSTLENPSYTYTDTGIYAIALTVTDSSPASETATKVGYITVYEADEAGDANADGVVDMGDVTKVERIILELDTATFWADANQDSAIDMGDVTKIERIILGLDC